MDLLSAPPVTANGRPWSLRFPPALEAEFQTDYRRRYRHAMRLALGAGLLALCSVGVLDFYWMPALARRLWQARLLCLLPMLALLGLALRKTGERHLQGLIVASSVCAAAMLLLCANLASEPYSHYYRSGLCLVILIVFVLSRLQFRHGALSAALIVLELNASFLLAGTTDLHQISPANFLVLASAACALAGTWLIEQHIRQNFLQGRQLAERLHELEDANLRLARLSAQDSLTRLANRAALDSTLNLEFHRARRQRQPLALIMIDVDHFKAYNDHFGHQAGDDCLRRIAATLHAALRRPTDLAARYGGEEFCLILPGASVSEAALVAERARAHIDALRLNHPEAELGHVSISLGVAALIPAPGDSPDSLLHSADQALYRAKGGGRNRVEVAA